MKKLILFVLSLLFLVPVKLTAQKTADDSGSLLMIAPEGFRVYLDDSFIGFTNNEQDGLLIENLAIGEYTIELRKGSETTFTSVVVIESGQIKEELFEPDKKEYAIKTNGYYVAFTKGTHNDKNGRFISNTHGINVLAFRPNGRFVLMEDQFGQNRNRGAMRNHVLSYNTEYLEYTYSGSRYASPILEFWPGKYEAEGDKILLIYDQGTSKQVTIIDDQSTILRYGEIEYTWNPD